MTAPVSLPLWLLIAIGVLAAWAVLDRLLVPSVRWFIRRRVNRVLDTRTSSGGRLPAGGRLAVDLSADVPASTSAVAVNIAAVDPASPGFLTAFACDTQPPSTSNVNFTSRTRGAGVIATLSASRRLCVTSPVETDVMPIELLSASVTFEPSAKFAPPPVITKLVVPATLKVLSRSNSTSRLLERYEIANPLACAVAPLTLTAASRPKSLPLLPPLTVNVPATALTLTNCSEP